jgi:hypothetical protein
MSNSRNTSAKAALVVHACDRYRLLFQGFEYFFNRHWPNVESINLYFLTEEIDHPSERFTNLKTGKAEWSVRLRAGLQQLSEPLVIYMQEDMWLIRPVDKNVLSEVVDFASAENLRLLKLNSSDVYRTRPTGKVIGGLAVSQLDNRASKYLVSHQPSIWNREFLLTQLTWSERPWRHESMGTKRLRKLNLPLYQIDLLAENGNPPINDNPYDACRGEYRTLSFNGLLNGNVWPFLEELMKSADPEIIAYAQRLQHNFINQLTHDGLPQPRKPRFWKRVFSFGR